MLEIIKILLGIDNNTKDVLLNIYLEKAQSKFKNYCNRIDIPAEAESCIVDYAIVLYNRRGSEGLQSESYSGVNQNFEVGIPNDVKIEWNTFRKVKTL
jgi:hypothetical protein